MSFAVRLPAAAPAVHRRMRLALFWFAAAAIGLAWTLAAPATRPWFGAGAVAAAAAILLRARLRATGEASGVLQVDDAGKASWLATGAPDPVRVEVQGWHLLGRMAWLKLRAVDEAGASQAARSAFDVLLWGGGANWPERGGGREDPDRCHFAEGGVTADDWRRLRVWLLWYGRGLPVTAGRVT